VLRQDEVGQLDRHALMHVLGRSTAVLKGQAQQLLPLDRALREAPVDGVGDEDAHHRERGAAQAVHFGDLAIAAEHLEVAAKLARKRCGAFVVEDLDLEALRPTAGVDAQHPIRHALAARQNVRPAAALGAQQPIFHEARNRLANGDARDFVLRGQRLEVVEPVSARPPA